MGRLTGCLVGWLNAIGSLVGLVVGSLDRMVSSNGLKIGRTGLSIGRVKAGWTVTGWMDGVIGCC